MSTNQRSRFNQLSSLILASFMLTSCQNASDLDIQTSGAADDGANVSGLSTGHQPLFPPSSDLVATSGSTNSLIVVGGGDYNSDSDVASNAQMMDAVASPRLGFYVQGQAQLSEIERLFWVPGFFDYFQSNELTPERAEFFLAGNAACSIPQNSSLALEQVISIERPFCYLQYALAEKADEAINFDWTQAGEFEIEVNERNRSHLAPYFKSASGNEDFRVVVRKSGLVQDSNQEVSRIEVVHCHDERPLQSYEIHYFPGESRYEVNLRSGAARAPLSGSAKISGGLLRGPNGELVVDLGKPREIRSIQDLLQTSSGVSREWDPVVSGDPGVIRTFVHLLNISGATMDIRSFSRLNYSPDQHQLASPVDWSSVELSRQRVTFAGENAFRAQIFGGDSSQVNYFRDLSNPMNGDNSGPAYLPVTRHHDIQWDEARGRFISTAEDDGFDFASDSFFPADPTGEVSVDRIEGWDLCAAKTKASLNLAEVRLDAFESKCGAPLASMNFCHLNPMIEARERLSEWPELPADYTSSGSPRVFRNPQAL